MQVSEILQEIDNEIGRLQQVRAILAGGDSEEAPKKRRGRKKKAVRSSSAATKAAAKTKTKRKLSPEGRKRIADAMKRRWAERKKQVPAK